MNCPLDQGTRIDVYFSYFGVAPVRVWVEIGGCEYINSTTGWGYDASALISAASALLAS